MSDNQVRCLDPHKQDYERRNKFISPPDILLKVFAVFLLVVFVLATSKIIGEPTVAALLGAIASGTLGIAISGKKK